MTFRDPTFILDIYLDRLDALNWLMTKTNRYMGREPLHRNKYTTSVTTDDKFLKFAGCKVFRQDLKKVYIRFNSFTTQPCGSGSLSWALFDGLRIFLLDQSENISSNDSYFIVNNKKCVRSNWKTNSTDINMSVLICLNLYKYIVSKIKNDIHWWILWFLNWEYSS